MARREEGAYREYATDEQGSQAGCATAETAVQVSVPTARARLGLPFALIASASAIVGAKLGLALPTNVG